MNPRVPFLRILSFLCLAALFGAQVFGLARGYICDCSGLMEWTAQDHCHGPHGADCHSDETVGRSHEESDNAPDRRNHEQVRDDAQWRLAQSMEVPALVPVLVAVLGGDAIWPAGICSKVSGADFDVGTGPPPGVAVARTTVLLI